jgi:magnesium-transporting ATPase (P-type)
VVTGQDLAEAGKGSPAFIALVARGRVFARVAPIQKLEIVEALREAGHFVAVTGDGVNDAPALKAGNIGVAMGSGSDVTKDTASLIVTDDNFASIEAGVAEGRFAYDNIRKVTYLLISTGLAEVVLVLSTLLLGLPLPLLAVQLLWLNLVTNGIQHVALAFEGGEPGAMQRPPRKPTEGIFNEQMIRQVVLSGAAMGAISTAYFWALIQTGTSDESARNQVLMLFVLMQNVHVFNCRSEHVSAFRVPLSRNRMLAVGVLAALGVHIAATYIPFMQRVLRTEPLLVEQLAYPLVLALMLIALMEFYKWQKAKRGLGA